MPAPWTPPPALPIDLLLARAKIDYLTLAPHTRASALPALQGSLEVVRPSRKNGRNWKITVHDPARSDVVALQAAMGNAFVMALEIAVDLVPKHELDDAQFLQVLEQTFSAVAARFRPEDQALWDHGQRGAVKERGGKVEPLERRLVEAGEEVIYGGRGEFMQAKLYHKTLDHGAELGLRHQSVRLEITLRRWACHELGIDHVGQLLGYPFRKRFATHFRMIDRPELRASKKLSIGERNRRTKRMNRAWSTAGVGKFAVGDRPRAESLKSALTRVRARERAQLSVDEYKLIRDIKANAKIGNALINLERKMAR